VFNQKDSYIMLLKFNLAVATTFSGLTGVFTGIYVHHNSVKTNEEFNPRKLEQIDSNSLTNLLHSETSFNKVSELKDEPSSLLNQPSILTDSGSLDQNSLLGKDSVGSVTKALLAAGPRPVACPGGESNSVNVQESNLFSVLEHLPLPVTANQHFAFSFFMFNMTVLICLMGLILNHYSPERRATGPSDSSPSPGAKLYGDQYLEKLPKWILPIAKHSSNLKDDSNHYYILTIFVTTIMSTMGSMILYYLG
jgi:hypothetical protein